MTPAMPKLKKAVKEFLADVPPHDQVTRLFRVCNTGNNADTFSITRFDLTAPATLSALYFDNDASATVNNASGVITGQFTTGAGAGAYSSTGPTSPYPATRDSFRPEFWRSLSSFSR